MKSNQLRSSGRHTAAPRNLQRKIAITTIGLLALGMHTPAQAATQVIVKNPGGIVAVGPVNTDTGFPSFYQDSAGTRLELCLDALNPLCGFLPGDVPNAEAPITFPDNFPDEAFYMLASSELEFPGGGSAVLVLGLEAAFANAVQAGDQVVFGRQRVVVKDGPANTTLTFTHPYGSLTLDTDAAGDGKLVEDISPAIENFTTPLKSNIGPFLKWDPAQAPAAPDGYLGNPDAEHTVTGSPFGTNAFSVTGGGVNLSTNLFGLQGKISSDGTEPPLNPNDVTAPLMTAQAPAAAATGIPVAANITASFSESVAGFNPNNVRLTHADGTVVASTISYDAATRTVTVDPSASLANNTVYTMSLTAGIQDASANALAPASWSFTTDVAPAVTARTPVANAVDFPLGNTVSATFSEDVLGIDATTVTLATAAGTAVPATISYDAATRTATLDPTANLALGTTYKVSLSNAIHDASGSLLPATAWTFTTDAAPVITGRTPAVNATNVARTGNVDVRFSEVMTGVNATNMRLTTSTGAAVSAVVTFDAATRLARLNPTATLAAGTRYTVSLGAGIKDPRGNALPATTWSFTTDPLPTVTGRTPAANATNVARTTNVAVKFSEPVTGINTTTVRLTNPAGTNVAAAVTYNATTRTATLNPSATLAAGTRYTVRLSNGIKDARSNPLTATTWSFTTDPLPTITGRTPAANATNVARTTNVTVKFSEAVSGVNTTNLWLTSPTGAKVAAAVSYNATTRTATLNPTASLALGTRYTVRLSSGIKDVRGNPLTATTWAFTTDPAPRVTGRSPAVNATNVARATNVTAKFSEPVSGINTTTVKLTNRAGATVGAVVSYNATTRTATLNPKASLAAGSRYTVRLSNGIKDARGNALAATTWSFTTGAR